MIRPVSAMWSRSRLPKRPWFRRPRAVRTRPPAAEQNRRPETPQDGFSLTELLIVLVIVGILVLLALPRFMGLVNRAKATEAKLALRQVQTLQQAHRLEYDRYGDELAIIGYEPNVLVTDGGQARYTVAIEQVSPDGFVATATSVVDFDGDGTLDTWEVDETGSIRNRTPD